MEQIMAYTNYQEYKQVLDTELTKAAEGFVRIGYLLKVARDTDILKDSGYANVVEFARTEYGIDKTQVSRFIHINDKFAEGGYSDHLLPQYQGFGYAKLSLMMLLPDEINEELSPDYSKTDIQTIKDEVDAENRITDIEVMLEEKDPEEKDLSLITQTIRRILEETPEIFREIHKTFQTEKRVEDLQSILAPNGDKTFTTRIPGTGRMMLIVKDKEPDVILINMRQNNEKTKYPWSEILQVISWLIKVDCSVEDAWRQQYESDYPLKKAQVAPVQQKRKESRVVPAKKPEKKEPEKKQKEPALEKRTGGQEKEQESGQNEQKEVQRVQEAVQSIPEDVRPETDHTETDSTETAEGQQDEAIPGQEDITAERSDVLTEQQDILTEPADTSTGQAAAVPDPEKVEGTPLYIRRKYMSHLKDDELADYLMRELKPRILTSRTELIRWLQEEV